MAVSAQFTPPRLKVRPERPQRYVVKQGDTSGVFPENTFTARGSGTACGGANCSDVRNPHMIYPGRVLLLRYVNGQPRPASKVQASIQTAFRYQTASARTRSLFRLRYPNRQCQLLPHVYAASGKSSTR